MSNLADKVKGFVRRNGGVKYLFKEAVPMVAGIATAMASRNSNLMSKTAQSLAQFIEWWQRKNEENLTSVSTATKMISVLLAYGLYKRFDPLPGKKIDKVVILGIASYLIGLLFFSKKNDNTIDIAQSITDSTQFEKMVAMGIEKLSPDEQKEVLVWARDLTSEQRQKFSDLFNGSNLVANDFIGLIHNEVVHDLLLRFTPPEKNFAHVANVFSQIKEFFARTSENIKPKIESVDDTITETIRNIRKSIKK